MKQDFSLRLYLVTDHSYLTEPEFLYHIREAAANGVTLIQLREKETSGRAFLQLAKKVKAITDQFHLPLLIDDRVDIAMAVNAAGVHLGQEDLPIEAARCLLGPDKIIGATAKTVEQAKKAEAEGADYLGVGAIFPTTTKVVTIRTSIEMLQDICKSVSIPAVAIGGLNLENMKILAGVLVDGIAVVSAIMKENKPGEAAQRLRAKSDEMFSATKIYMHRSF